MRRALAVLIFALLAPSADAATVWHPTGGGRFTLDQSALRTALRGRVVPIPAPDGSLLRVRFHGARVMSRRLARSVGFRSFAGRGVRFDVGRLGFHASVRGRGGTWNVDPLGGGRYVAHRAARLLGLASERVVRHRRRPGRVARAGGGNAVRHEYRLALVSDPPYAAQFAGATPAATDANVTTAKGILMDRVNQVYNEDLGVQLTLTKAVNLNTSAVFLASYPADTDCDDTIDVNTAVLNSKVGAANYDIGHIVMGVNGGGVAGLGVVGSPTRKGEGCTGIPDPVGDAFAIDYVAHEMGHQFGADHTFNGTKNTCGTQRHNATAVEPGSGSSVMGYAGICGTDDLQGHSDPYFSQASIAEVGGFVASIPSVGTLPPTTNRTPVVLAPPASTIPIRTPFALLGGATDADADALTYLWEENDPGTGTALMTDGKATGPLFRQFGVRATEANPSAYGNDGENLSTGADFLRSFPDPAQVAADTTTAASGTCASSTNKLDCYSEYLPTTARAMKFRLTARDGHGGVSSADTTVTAAGTTPFRVSAPAGGSATGGAAVPLAWNVAGTANAPINTPTVRVSFSADGGLTFPYPVLAATPNDGSEAVVVPNVVTTHGRFRVEGVGNVFFDVSHGDLSVTSGSGPTPSPGPSPTPLPGTPTPDPSPSPSTTPSSAYYDIPSGPAATSTATATTSPTATPIPQSVAVAPSLGKTAKRLRVSSRRRLKVRVSCRAVGDGRPPTRCAGTLTARARLGRHTRRIARAAFSVPTGTTRTVTLRISRRAYRRLGHGRKLVVRLRATVGAQAASRRVTVRKAA